MTKTDARAAWQKRRARRAAPFVLACVAAAACGGAPEPGDDEASLSSLAQACSANAYRAGASYAAGDRVTVAGKAYECKPFPYSGWCSIGGPYAPGEGSHWQEAWTEVGSCAGGGGGGSAGVAAPSGGGACNAAPWQAGKAYRTGDVVLYGGRAYIAEHDNPGYDPTISTWFWEPHACSGGGGGGAPPPPTPPAPPPPSTGGSGFERILSRSAFEAMFPGRNGFYTYDGLVQATRTYPAFATSGSAEVQKREVAAFLANVNHETGSLVYVEEIAKGEYCEGGAPGCPCVPGKRYFGRGPIQLSWNYNYCAASQSIFGDKEVLRTDPDRVAREPWLAWATGLFFWMTQTGAGSMTSHDAMVNGSNFGETIRTINGALECGGRNPGQVQSRVDAYLRFCQLLGVSPGGRTSC